ncbi:unnamed protein product [Linum trigynum]|uniref:Uncharacterized protein n=1 Tax=Linum trigynum TaxID=586398 RepID=A0AAV2GTA2_9ROSI
MRNCGEDMPDEKIMEKILGTLPDNFNYVICSIKEFKDIDLLTIDALQNSLLVHELKFNKKFVTTMIEEDQVLRISLEHERGGRGQGRGFYPGRGRIRGRGGTKKQLSASGATNWGISSMNVLSGTMTNMLIMLIPLR